MTGVTVVDPRLSERLEHLRRANDQRSIARLAKERVARDGVGALLEVLTSGDAGCLRIHELLEACPSMGEAKVERLLKGQKIWPLRRVRLLTERQQRELVREIERQAAARGWVR